MDEKKKTNLRVENMMSLWEKPQYNSDGDFHYFDALWINKHAIFIFKS